MRCTPFAVFTFKKKTICIAVSAKWSVFGWKILIMSVYGQIYGLVSFYLLSDCYCNWLVNRIICFCTLYKLLNDFAISSFITDFFWNYIKNLNLYFHVKICQIIAFKSHIQIYDKFSDYEDLNIRKLDHQKSDNKN